MGHSSDGRPTFVCRGAHNEGTHLGYTVGAGCIIGWGGGEVVLSRYEIMVSPTGYWTAPGDPVVMSQTIVGGEEADGRPLIVCRVEHAGALLPGKVVSDHCNVAADGVEHSLSPYEVFAIDPRCASGC